MAKAVLTHCTNCVAPTAPVVSEGAQLHGLAGVLLVSPTPSKFKPAVVPTCGPGVEDWTTGSAWVFAPCATGRRRKGWVCSWPGAWLAISALSGRETS